MSRIQKRLQVLNAHLNPQNQHDLAEYDSISITSELSSNKRASRPNSRKLPLINGDYLRFDEMLTNDQRATRYRVRKFMETFVAPIADEYYEKAEFPLHLLPQLSKEGILAGSYTGEYENCANCDLVTSCITTMEMSRIDNSFSALYSIHGGIVMPCISLLGSEEQKRKYLPKMGTLECVGAFALTEPNYGSDASSLECTAEPTEDGKGWILNGTKRWIGAATHADIIVVWARNTKTRDIHGFIVKKGNEGFSAKKIENKMSLRTMQNGEIRLNNCYVSEEDRLPGATNFRTGPARILEMSRVNVAWMAIGMSIGAYEATLKYLRQRKQFGHPLVKFQLIQEKLVRILGNIQAMLMLAWRITQLFMEGKMTPGQSAMAKGYISLRARESMALARELLGGNGIVYDFGVARHFADVEAVYTFEGTYEVNTMVTGREITGYSAFK